MKFLLLAPLLFSVLACQPHPIGGGEVEGTGIIRGARIETEDQAAAFTVGLFYLTSDKPCTAIVIGRKTLLTAAHCISSTDMRVAFGAKVSLKSANATIEKVIVHEDYDPKTYLNDLALLLLAEDVPNGIEPISLFEGEALTGSIPVESYGFSVFTDDSNTNVFDYLEGTAGILKQSAHYNEMSEVELGGKLLLAEFKKDKSILLHQQTGGICFGDSGGPTVLAGRDEKILIGVNWYGGRTPKGQASCSREGAAVAVSGYIDWIKENAEEPLTTRDNDYVSKTLFSRFDSACLRAYVNSLNVFSALPEFSSETICQKEVKLREVLQTAFDEAEKFCISPLAHFYPTFIKNSAERLEAKCDIYNHYGI